jgi:hypothetical protein
MVAITLRADLSRGLTNAEIDANFSNLKTAVEAAALSAAWASLTGKPTTLSGYGITDAQSALVSGTSIKTVNGQSVLGSGNIQIDGGVTSFNTRTGAITLGSSDVTTALGFTPYNSTNPSGFITQSGARGAISVSGSLTYNATTGVISYTAPTLSSLDVVSALGYTPYNATNPSGYISGINSSMVTSALGFTPYNSSNPDGYITSSGSISGSAGSISGFNNPATAATANTIVYRDGSGNITGNYIIGSYLYASAGDSTNPTIGQIWTQSTTDSYLRKSTPAYFISHLGLLTTSNYSSYAPTFLGNYERSTNARITGSAAGAMGLVGVDSTNAFRFQVYGDGTNYGFLSSVWGNWSWKGDASGNWTATANITAYSDESLKTDWAPLATDFVEQLALIKSGTYTRIDINERQAGSSAQGWRKLLPEVVQEGSDGILALAYGNAALVSAVELAKRVVKLEERLNKLGA